MHDPLAGPGSCNDLSLWKRAATLKGFVIFYGSKQVFTSGIRGFDTLMPGGGMGVIADEDQGGIHAWPEALSGKHNRKEDKWNWAEGLGKPRHIISKQAVVRTYISP